MKPNYILIPALVISVAIAGSRLTGAGMDWYATIHLPAWTPPGAIIGAVWTTIFTLCAAAILKFWNSSPRDNRFRLTAGLFALNGLLNVGWSYLFFFRQSIGAALFEMHLLLLSILLLIVLLYPRVKLSAVLLVPYAAWVAFATFLTYNVWVLNR